MFYFSKKEGMKNEIDGYVKITIQDYEFTKKITKALIINVKYILNRGFVFDFI